MVAGVWLHLTERHQHQHRHEALAHDHPHVHDERLAEPNTRRGSRMTAAS
jgi:hypothetical protein